MLSNPLATRQYVYFLGGDDRRRKGEQTIEEQTNELHELEAESQLARVEAEQWVKCRTIWRLCE